MTVDGQLISSIGRGLLVLAAISKDDTEKDIESMPAKILKAKLWDDESSDPPGKVGSLWQEAERRDQSDLDNSGKRMS